MPRPEHTGPKHTGPKHTGPKHTGPKHTGPKHTGPKHTGLRLLAGPALAAVLLAGCGGGGTTASPSATASSPAPERPSSSPERPAAVRPVTVVDAPTRIAETAAGPVGYREVGAGRPLLLVMGLGGSMDDWEPAFVASLAAGHKVVMFDNAGVGKTAAAAPSITAMAGQASALISALRLGPAAVLGWSMGGMIAQALAVLHPAQVSRLILAATQPGTGDARPILAAAAAAAASANPGAVLSVLFPPGQAAAEQAYVAGILRYPGFYQAPRAVVAGQERAIQQWIAGQDGAGRKLGDIRLPTLVADGTLDQLDPVANDQALARSVPGSTLILYPGAGHAFLFQDSASFLAAVQRFLGT